ncbi:hypothetical protein D3C80_1764040 [compost metagenome]
MNKVRFHREGFPVEGIFARGMEVELLKDEFFAVEGDEISLPDVHLHAVAVIDDADRRQLIAEVQRARVHFQCIFDIDR